MSRREEEGVEAVWTLRRSRKRSSTTKRAGVKGADRPPPWAADGVL
jgi:hypothetical protein